jgi:arylsulfatase
MRKRIFAGLGVASLLAAPVLCAADTPTDGSVLPFPQPPFKGVINKTAKESTPSFPALPSPPPGAPNVLLILTDDVGFGATSPFGGPIQTPTFQAVSDAGIRYSAFHTTALCSPTRAALITGRNHHSCASGVITEMATGFPGYNSLVPPSCGTVAQVLRAYGYNTAWFGKMHNVPDFMSSMAGPFDLWPTSLGFDYFFGFLGGDADQWHTPAFEDNVPIELPEQQNGRLTHFDSIMANRAITWIQNQHAIAPQHPWLLYYATGTAHAPHHAPADWIAKYKGKFDQGWDVVREQTLARQKKLGIMPPYTDLTARPPEIPAWNTLTPDQKRLYAHMMEVYAGALSYADYEIGRVIDAVRKTGQLDNTIVIYEMGDNGASAEGTLQGTTNEVGEAANGVTESIPFLLSQMNELGGPHTYNHYPVGWAHAMDAPMQWTKQVASHFGGTRNGLAIAWPKKIKAHGVIRSQFSSVIDITPTLYEAIGITPPLVLYGAQQKPIDGTSMVYTWDPANSDAPTRHTIQYFELVGNRALYKDGWIASTTPLRLPWITSGLSPDPNDFKWELYDLSKDPSQAHNLATKYPEKLAELQAAFDQEAQKYQVYPLDSSFAERADPSIRPSLTSGRTQFAYYPGAVRIPEGSAPNFKNQSWVVAADVVVPKGGANGVLATIGGYFGGWALLVMNGKPEFVYGYSNQPQDKTRIIAPKALPPGRHVVRVNFAYAGGGIGKAATATLFVDGAAVAHGTIPKTIAGRFSLDETFDIGEDTGTPVVLDYEKMMPFAFSGTLNQVAVVLQPEKLTDAQRRALLKAEAEADMAAQ